jgi:glycosyltransferase involved in cell wall biosynthesis
MLAPATPEATGNGLAMRLGMFLDALARRFDVDLVVAPIAGGADSGALSWAAERAAKVHVLDVARTLDTHFGLIERVASPEARAEAFARFGRPSLCARLGVRAALLTRDLVGAGRYDLVHAARSYCASWALHFVEHGTGARRPTLSLDLDEDDERVYLGLAKRAESLGESLLGRWNRAEAAGFVRLRDETVPFFDRVWISSEVDLGHMEIRGLANDIVVAPNAVTFPRSAARRDDGRTLMFVGALGYVANEDAVAWFLKAVWPNLRKRDGLRLRIVGGAASERIKELADAPGIALEGWVEDLRPFYETASLTVAPIRIGAGTRIKLLESAAFETPIVSTSIGAEGLGMSGDTHLWLADSAADFRAAIEAAIDDPVERRRRALAAKDHVKRHFERRSQVRRLSEALLHACEARSATGMLAPAD